MGLIVKLVVDGRKPFGEMPEQVSTALFIGIVRVREPGAFEGDVEVGSDGKGRRFPPRSAPT